MPEEALQTARFEIHNPSRHKQAVLLAALRDYHRVARTVLAQATAHPELLSKCLGRENAKGIAAPNRYVTAKLVRELTPLRWNMAPLRDYLIGDVAAAIMSYLAKNHKGKNKANLPTIPALEGLTDQEYDERYRNVTLQPEFSPSDEHQLIIDRERTQGHPRVAHRLEQVFSSRAATKALSELLRSTDGSLPRPLEFTHCEWGRGFLLVRRNDRYYCMMRLFSPSHRHYGKKTLAAGLVELKTGKDLGGKSYPGLILPLAMSRDFQVEKYLRAGTPRSAKLVARRGDDGRHRFFIHIAFRFSPEAIAPDTVLGIDRGAAIIGAASVISMSGKLLQKGINCDGAAFAAEMRRYEERIRREQRAGIQRSRRFRLRGARANIILGEYANQLIQAAVAYRSQIVIEKIDQVGMSRFLKQSQFAKLKQMLTYKAKRCGLPEPIEVPPAFTSQTCACCGHRDRLNRSMRDDQGKPLQDRFQCTRCGHAGNADENASIVIAFRGLHQIEHGKRFQKWAVFAPWLEAKLGWDGRSIGQ
jgi:IS605 OrfB family transposase